MSQKIYLIAIYFFSNNVTSKLGVFNIFKADKINIKCALQKRNFKVLVLKSRRSFWGHAWCHKKLFYVTQWPQNSLIKSSRYLWDTLYSILHVYWFWGFFPEYMFIPLYIFINFWLNIPPYSIQLHQIEEKAFN
jgi:hypothetical protein